MEMYRKIRQMIHNNYLDLTKLWNRKDYYKNSFDAVLEELNGFVMNHEENDNVLPSQIYENTSGQSDKSSWSTHTKEISDDDENYLEDQTVWNRIENASCPFSDESNHENHDMLHDQTVWNRIENASCPSDDDENYLEDQTVWDRMENASCTFFDESNHENHDMNIIYRLPHLDLEMGENDNYYDEGGCPFDSDNLANWDGDQQVGFRE